MSFYEDTFEFLSLVSSSNPVGHRQYYLAKKIVDKIERVSQRYGELHLTRYPSMSAVVVCSKLECLVLDCVKSLEKGDLLDIAAKISLVINMAHQDGQMYTYFGLTLKQCNELSKIK